MLKFGSLKRRKGRYRVAEGDHATIASNVSASSNGTNSLNIYEVNPSQNLNNNTLPRYILLYFVSKNKDFFIRKSW
jgi:hypothetical protein